jgi:hypothetical protein
MRAASPPPHRSGARRHCHSGPVPCRATRTGPGAGTSGAHVLPQARAGRLRRCRHGHGSRDVTMRHACSGAAWLAEPARPAAGHRRRAARRSRHGHRGGNPRLPCRCMAHRRPRTEHHGCGGLPSGGAGPRAGWHCGRDRRCAWKFLRWPWRMGQHASGRPHRSHPPRERSGNAGSGGHTAGLIFRTTARLAGRGGRPTPCRVATHHRQR